MMKLHDLLMCMNSLRKFHLLALVCPFGCLVLSCFVAAVVFQSIMSVFNVFWKLGEKLFCTGIQIGLKKNN